MFNVSFYAKQYYRHSNKIIRRTHTYINGRFMPIVSSLVYESNKALFQNHQRIG
jgi:hypothetical protein